MIYIVIFLVWTLYLYLIHRACHTVHFLKRIHRPHHIQVQKNQTTHWHWTNLFLFTDTVGVTVDMWVTEVIPTIIFSSITGHWWLCIFYYIWAAFFQEPLEHNLNNNFYPLTAGKWHLIHHKNLYHNYGLFLPIWDKVFKTEKLVGN
jgi:sterol desaturase/sphingolipid hydroxylase (fatty acid hydroxylase superfamily)